MPCPPIAHHHSTHSPHSSPKSLHQTQFDLLLTLCYRRNGVMKMEQNSGKTKAPRKSAGPTTLLVRPHDASRATRALNQSTRQPFPRTPRSSRDLHPTFDFLIATPRLKFPLTNTKQSPLNISNRDYIAVFHSKSSAPSACHHVQGAISPSSVSHRPVKAFAARLSRITSHELRVTAVLIYRAAIRNAAN
jgi:hypothetical protein